MCKESACVCSELPGLVGQLQPQKAAFLRTSGGEKNVFSQESSAGTTTLP